MFGFVGGDAQLRRRRRKLAERFRSKLAKAREFSTNSAGNRCASSKCAFEFSFERFSADEYVLMVVNPANSAQAMHSFLLGLMYGVKTGGTPEEIAAALSRHFPSLLDGDFSIHSRYQSEERALLDGLMKTQKLDQAHPIRRKIEAADVTWLDDLKRL